MPNFNRTWHRLIEGLKTGGMNLAKASLTSAQWDGFVAERRVGVKTKTNSRDLADHEFL